MIGDQPGQRCSAMITGADVLLDGAELRPLAGQRAVAGPLGLTIEQVVVLPERFEDPFDGSEWVADGRFVGVQLTVANDTSGDIQPATQLHPGWHLTSGDENWPVADQSLRHGQGISAAWSAAVGDRQPETILPPGYRITTWAVFDLPAKVEPDLLVLRTLDSDHCVPLPFSPTPAATTDPDRG
jgi:hypothetical protein